MKEILASVGIQIKFACADVERCLSLAEAWGYPVIVKPLRWGGKRRRHRVEDAATLASLHAVDMANYEIEEFVEGAIYHVDGYADARSTVKSRSFLNT